MANTFTPQELRTQQIEDMWTHFHNLATRTSGSVELRYYCALSTEYGAAVKQFAEELQAKGWSAVITEVKRSALAVFWRGGTRIELNVTIGAKRG